MVFMVCDVWMMVDARCLVACVVRWMPSWCIRFLFSSINCIEMMLLWLRSSRMVLSLVTRLSISPCFVWSRLYMGSSWMIATLSPCSCLWSLCVWWHTLWLFPLSGCCWFRLGGKLLCWSCGLPWWLGWGLKFCYRVKAWRCWMSWFVISISWYVVCLVFEPPMIIILLF